MRFLTYFFLVVLFFDFLLAARFFIPYCSATLTYAFLAGIQTVNVIGIFAGSNYELKSVNTSIDYSPHENVLNDTIQ